MSCPQEFFGSRILRALQEIAELSFLHSPVIVFSIHTHVECLQCANIVPLDAHHTNSITAQEGESHGVNTSAQLNGKKSRRWQIFDSGSV